MNIPEDERIRVLLIPDRIQWILGTIAKEIAKWNPELDLTIISEAYINSHIDDPRCFLNSFDVVHFLGELLYGRYGDGVHSTTISSIHHVTDWEMVKGNVLADMVVVGSREWEKCLISKGVPEAKVFLMPYGVDTDVFVPLSPKKRRKLRRRIGLSEESIAVGFFANSSYSTGKDRKGTDILLEAFRVLRGRSDKEIVLILAGIGWERFEQTFLEYGIPHFHFDFVLNHEDMSQKYGILDFYLITSRIEGGPVTLLEAMSCGVPVITTPVGMAIDVVRDVYNGIMIPKEDPEAVAGKLIELMENPELAFSIANNARDTMVNSYKWQDSARRIPDLYEKALNAHSRREHAGNNLQQIDAGKRLKATFILKKREIFIEEQLLWADYLLAVERRASFRIVLMLCVRYPWNPRIWRHLFVRFGGERTISCFVKLKALLRRAKLTH